MLESVVGDLSQSPSQFDACRSSTYNDECQQGAEVFDIGFPFRSLKCVKNAPPNFNGVFNRLKARGKGFPMVVAEIMVTRTGCDDQGIIGAESR